MVCKLLFFLSLSHVRSLNGYNRYHSERDAAVQRKCRELKFRKQFDFDYETDCSNEVVSDKIKEGQSEQDLSLIHI